MDAMLERWAACPRCGGDLADADAGVTCQSCGTHYGEQDGLLDLVDPSQKVSSEGPGDTLAMAWRRRRWDELRGPEAPENAAYLAAIWERLRPDDRVVDLGCGPGSFLAWMAEFAPDLAILGLDLSWGALEEAGRVRGARPNVRLVRASTRRRLPLRDASTDVVLRRLAPGLPEEIVRVLAPGGHYLRFTFGPQHWREVYDLMPGLPRAREDTLVGEAERLRQLGLEVEEPIHESGSEEFSLPAVLLALRSNPAAFHAERLDLKPLRQLWRTGDGGRATRIPLTTDYAILVARRPAEGVAVPAPALAATAAGEEAGAAEAASRLRTGATPAEPVAPAAEAAGQAPAAEVAGQAPAAEAPGETPAVQLPGQAPAAEAPAALATGPEPASAAGAAAPPRRAGRAASAAGAAPEEETGAGAGARPRSRRTRAPAEGAQTEATPAAEVAGTRRRARRTADGGADEGAEAGPRRRSRRVAAPSASEAAPESAPGDGGDGAAAETPRRRSRKAAPEPPAGTAGRRARKVAPEPPPATPRRRARKAGAESDGDSAEGAPGQAAAEAKPKRTRSRKPAANGEGG